MNRKRTGLGRGLDALIPNTPESGETQADFGQPHSVPTSQIIPNPKQPRKIFNEDELAQLAASIKEHGIIQPLIVTLGSIPGQYILIAGERRLQAAGLAGLSEVPVVIRSANQQEMLELALIENVQRADLNPLETARAYKLLQDEFNLTQEAIATRVGRSRVSIANTLRLLNLTQKIQHDLLNLQLTEGHARALLAVPAELQDLALKTLHKMDMSVRQTEELSRKLSGQIQPIEELAQDVLMAWLENQVTDEHIAQLIVLRTKEMQSAALKTILEKHLNPEETKTLLQQMMGTKVSKPVQEVSPEIKDLEEQLGHRLETKVSVNHRGNNGNLVIYYYSQEELENILDKILGTNR